MVQKSSQGFINKVGNIIKFALYKQDILDFEHTHCVSDITDFASHVPEITPSEIAKWGGNSLISDDSSNISVADPSGTQLVSPSSYTLNDLLPTIQATTIDGEQDDLSRLFGDYESPKLYRIVYKHGVNADQFLLYCDGISSGILRQTLIRPDGFWTRTNSNGWTSWEKIYYALQNDINDVYSRIMLVIQQEVANLNVSLSGKSNVGHTHPIEEFPSVISWVNEQLDTSSKSTLEYVDSVEEKLQKEIDKTVDSYFGKGVPTLHNYPAEDWIIYDPDTHEEDGEATYAEYSKHEGDTYTNIQQFKKLDVDNWEQGIVLADQALIDVESFTTCKQNSTKAVRYKNLIDYEAGDTLQVLSGNTDYMIYVTYFDTYEIFKGYSTYRVSNEDQEIPLSDSYSKCNISIRSISDQDITTSIVPDLCLYINSTAGHSWRFCKEVDEFEQTTWSWIQIADSDAIKALLLASEAKDLANQKKRVFITGLNQLPSVPYDLGDLWVNATGTWTNTIYRDELLRCKVSRNSSDTANISDWVPASEALQKANLAVDILSDIKSSNIVTPQEKNNLKKEWEEIQARYTESYNQATSYSSDSSVDTCLTALNEAFKDLKSYLVGTEPLGNLDNIGVIGKNGSVNADIMQDSTESSGILNDLSSLFKEYYKAELDVLNAISNAIANSVDKKEICGENLTMLERTYSFEKLNNLPTYIPLSKSSFEKGKYIFSAQISAIKDNGDPITNVEATIVDDPLNSTIRHGVVNGMCTFTLASDSPLYLQIQWIDLVGATVTIKNAMLQKGEKKTEYQPCVKHITDSLHDVTDVQGLVLSEPLVVKDTSDVVSAGISGVSGTTQIPENVLLWGGGTYADAVNASNTDYYKSGYSGNLITTLLKKDGTGKIGCARIIDNDTISLVTSSGTVCITDKSMDNVMNLRSTYSGQLSGGIGIRYDDNPNEYVANDVVAVEKEFTITEGGSFTILVPNMSIGARAITKSNSLSGNQVDIGNAYASVSGRFCIRILNNGRLIYKSYYLSPALSVESDNTTGTGEEVMSSTFETTPQINGVFALSPGSVKIQVFGSYEIKANADEISSTCSGGTARAAIDFNSVNVSLTGTDKYCVLAKDGIAVTANSGAQFYIKNNGSGLQVIASGLPTSDSGLESGQLWVNTITYKDDHDDTMTAKVLCVK